MNKGKDFLKLMLNLGASDSTVTCLVMQAGKKIALAYNKRTMRKYGKTMLTVSKGTYRMASYKRIYFTLK